jgi:glycosyl hydrolase family 76
LTIARVVRRRPTAPLAALLCAAGLSLAAATPAPAKIVTPEQLALPPSAQLEVDRARFGELAKRGVADARARWFNSGRSWWVERLNDTRRYPLATIWGVVPLWEALNARAIASPTAANRSAVNDFARGAERYFDPALRPHGGYAPYMGDRGGRERAWFDDNGWWGIAFVDAYRATGNRRYLNDAARALRFIAETGWASSGGLWWDTTHPHKSGEALASGTALAAMLYEATGDGSYLRTARKFIGWADAHFTWKLGLYRRNDSDPTPMGYVEGPMIGAHEILCRVAHDAGGCARVEELAENSLTRFGADVNHGPQYDTIYMRWMLELYQHDHDRRWYALVRRNALRAAANARDSRGLYMRAWSGGSAKAAAPGLLQTHAATVSLFAWLAAAPVPQD